MTQPPNLYEPILSGAAEDLLDHLRRNGGRSTLLNAARDLEVPEYRLRRAAVELKDARIIQTRGGTLAKQRLILRPPPGGSSCG